MHNLYIDKLEWSIMLFSHILMKQIQTDRWKVEILDKFGQTNTVRY